LVSLQIPEELACRNCGKTQDNKYMSIRAWYSPIVGIWHYTIQCINCMGKDERYRQYNDKRKRDN
jgi:hypothetical protein